MPPKPPHNPPPPPHRRHPKYGSLLTVILVSFLVSSVITFIIASIMLYFRLNADIMIPSLAPVWIGLMTISYMAQTEK